MDELYRMIEQKIKESGYTGTISGEDIYDDMCDQMEEQENGTYLLMSKFTDDLVIEYNITIMDDDFDLHAMTIRTSQGDAYEVKFD